MCITSKGISQQTKHPPKNVINSLHNFYSKNNLKKWRTNNEGYGYQNNIVTQQFFKMLAFTYEAQVRINTCHVQPLK